MGQLVQPSKAGAPAAAVALPPYDAEALTIVHDGETIKAPDGTKFITDDGQTFILRHARTVQIAGGASKTVAGGWKRLRSNPKPAADTAAPAEAPAAKRK